MDFTRLFKNYKRPLGSALETTQGTFFELQNLNFMCCGLLKYIFYGFFVLHFTEKIYVCIYFTFQT